MRGCPGVPLVASGKVFRLSQSQPNSETDIHQLMLISLIKRAAVIGALALAIAPAAAFSQWTTFSPGQLNAFSFTHAHRPDGRFVFGTGGTVSVQDAFGSPTFSTVNNANAAFFDPSFIAISPNGTGIIGGGGFFALPDPAPSFLFGFDSSDPNTPINITPLATLQNYSAVWWRHPTSGREGWLIAGGNGIGGTNNLTFVSSDGAFTGTVTTALSSFSGGLASDTSGNVYVGLADFNPAVDNLVLKFTAAQIDAAVLAILNSAPNPLGRLQATELFRAAAAGAIAVDGDGRLWCGGYQIDYLQAFDPSSGVTRRFKPLATPVPGYTGPPSFAPKAFSIAGEDRVSFLANDSNYTFGADLILGHADVEELPIRSVQFATTSRTVNEGDGVIEVTVTITPAPTQPVTIPVQISGTAVDGDDFFTATSEVVFDAGDSSEIFLITLIDDTTRGEPDETLILTLGEPTPSAEAGLGAPASEQFMLTIEDNDAPPAIVRDQSFPSLEVGAAFSHQVLTTRGTATRWTAIGLPPGLRIDPASGLISGIPTAAGDFDRVVITASNGFGRTTSVVYLLDVTPMPAATLGSFTCLVDRIGTATEGLGGRLELTTTAGATYTGRLTIGKKNHPVRGVLDSSSGNVTGFARVSVNGALLPLSFSLDAVTGALTGDLDGSVLTAWQNSTLPARVGIYHFILFTNLAPDDQPQGASFGTIRVPARGLPRIAGRTADGSRFACSSAVSTDGELLVYQALYRNPGTLVGSLTLDDDPAQSVSGTFNWSKPSQPTGALYRDGWAAPIMLNVIGGKYRPAAGATLLLEAAPSTGDNALLGLQDGGIDELTSDPAEFGVRILSATKLATTAPLRLRVNNKTGLISGRVPLSQSGVTRTATFFGLLIPTADPNAPFATSGYGHFVLPAAVRGQSRAGLLVLSAD